MSVSHSIRSFGERGLIATLDGFDAPLARSLFANRVADQMRALPGITDAVAGIDSITLRVDAGTLSLQSAAEALENAINSTSPDDMDTPSASIDIPVCYGGDYGPDIDDICTKNNLSRTELIDRHTRVAYRVAMLGFAPGFAYLGSSGDTLAASRLDTPRQHVAAGSIGVAGGFTGIYTLPSPGGWRIIGRTPISLFDKNSDKPFTVTPGMAIRFRAISESEFRALTSAAS